MKTAKNNGQTETTTPTRSAPGIFTSEDPIWVRVCDGIWRRTTNQQNVEADYPDKMLNPRPVLMKGMEAKNCQMLLGFWDDVQIDQCTSGRCDEYRDWRVENKMRSTAGTRMIDLELNTLTNAFRLAKRRVVVLFNPMYLFPGLRTGRG